MCLCVCVYLTGGDREIILLLARSKLVMRSAVHFTFSRPEHSPPVETILFQLFPRLLRLADNPYYYFCLPPGDDTTLKLGVLFHFH